MDIIIALLLLYAGYCAAVFFLFQVLPVLIYLSARFLGLCLREAGNLLLQAVWWLIVTGIPIAWAGIRNAALFVMIVIDELRHHDDARDDHNHGAADDGADHRDHHHDHAPDLIADAMLLLGLRPGFSRDELGQAYKQAIRRAHPDAGGSAEDAAAINVARDLLTQANGWA